ncbi:MAG: AgmX/PglI C-terminal domain-containing protein [Deltaproteobacteria bacterium]|nr:AgmX/PglI C-terminal domain-containing protein [Deltaproteobacteria bacterium]
MDGNSVPVNVAVVGVGADDAATRTAAERLATAGHEVIDSKQLAAGAPLLEVLTDWIEDERIDVVIAIANDTDPVRAALAPMITKSIPGFGELLRAAAFSEIGSAAMLLDGEAARCGATYVFVVPGTVGAVKVAMDHLLLPQLDLRTRPANLASRLPRLRGRAPAAESFAKREDTDPGTPPPPRNPTPAPKMKTNPPAPAEKPVTKTPPMGVVLRATPVDADAAKDAELITSDAAILIPPAEIVEPPAEIVDKPPAAEAPSDTVAAEQLGAFVMSLEKHAAQIRREKSQVGPLPTAPAEAAKPEPANAEPPAVRARSTTPPPPVPTTPPRGKTMPPPVKRTDAEMKALRDAQVADAISKVEKLPEAPADEAKPRKKNETTPQQWARAANDMEKISPRATRGDESNVSTASTVLGQGDRVIVIPQHKKRRAWLFLPIALVVGAGGAFVIKTQFLSGNRTAAAEPQPEHVEQTVKVEAIEPAPAPPPVEDQPKPLPPAVPEVNEIEMEPGGAANLTALAQAHNDHHAAHVPAVPATGAATGPAIAPAAGSAAKGSAAGSADDAPDPRTHPNIAPASADCDEAACILEHYQRECCARYKPAEMPAEKIDPAGPPETLDKAAVKAGIADVKPAVQQCGEEHYAKGTVKITLTVSADGAVTDATVSESPLPELGSCVASALKRASFAKTKNGAVFTYPFMF